MTINNVTNHAISDESDEDDREYCIVLYCTVPSSLDPSQSGIVSNDK